MIIGAGINGTYLGSRLGDQVIFERNKQMYEKACSALFSKNALKLGLPVKETALHEIKGARFFSEKQHFEVSQKDTQAFVCNRLEFQKIIAQEAIDNGCKIKYGEKWNGQNDDFVLGCDGALSSVAKTMNLKPRKFIYTYQVEANNTYHITKKEDIDIERVDLYFGDFAPGFFAWEIPLGDKRARIGIGTNQGNPKQKFDEFLKAWSITLEGVSKVQSALIPIFDGQKVVEENKALCGDAAAQVKNTTGGGILFGCMAANILKKAVDKQDLSYYEKTYSKELKPQLRDHARIRAFLNHTNYDTLFKAIRDHDIESLLAKHGDMEHTHKLKRELIKKPGFLLRSLSSLF